MRSVQPQGARPLLIVENFDILCPLTEVERPKFDTCAGLNHELSDFLSSAQSESYRLLVRTLTLR